jgi:hypothetical protein
VRAREVLQELLGRGIKQVGKERIVELERREEDLDYDTIMNFYQKVLRKEREAVEVQKNKKVNDVEIWNRALKEEESTAMMEYCEKHGQVEMENIRRAIQEKHAKELQNKRALESAKGAFASYKITLLAQRTLEHQQKQHEFAKKQGEKAKEEVVEEAKKQLMIITVRRMNEAAAEERRKRDLVRQAEEHKKMIAEGKDPHRGEDNELGWGRGTQIQQARDIRAADDARYAKRQETKVSNETGFQRGVAVVKAEEKKDGPPVFTRKPRD